MKLFLTFDEHKTFSPLPLRTQFSLRVDLYWE